MICQFIPNFGRFSALVHQPEKTGPQDEKGYVTEASLKEALINPPVLAGPETDQYTLDAVASDK